MSKTLRWFQTLWAGKPQQAQRLLRAYQALLGTTDGQLVMHDIARYANLFNSSFCPNDALSTAFNEGQRDLFLHITAMAGLDEKAVMALLLSAPERAPQSMDAP